MPKQISIPPKPSALIGSLRGLGYSIETAVADLIDNSIAAGASTLSIDMDWNNGVPVVSLLDDGKGMIEPTLLEALRLGDDGSGSRSEADLGRFGMGLKTASLSQSRRFTVVSKHNNVVAVASVDVATVQTLGWVADVPDDLPEHVHVDALLAQENGTVVIWDAIDELSGLYGLSKKEFYLRLEDVRAHLGMTFHRFIEGDGRRLAILLNGRRVKSWDPFQLKHPATIKLPSERVKFGHDSFLVKPYVLPHRDRFENEMEYVAAGGPSGWGARQGFYVYRGKRLLVAGSWLGLGGSRKWTRDETTRLARVLVDLPTGMDRAWRIDVRKAQAKPPGALYGRLTAIAFRCREEARKVFAYRGKGPRSQSKEQSTPQIWLSGSGPSGPRYCLNREHPIIIFLRNSNADRKAVDAVLSLIEKTVPVERIWLDVSESEGVEIPKVSSKELTHVIGELVSLGRKLPPSMSLEQRLDALLFHLPGDTAELRKLVAEKLGDGP